MTILPSIPGFKLARTIPHINASARIVPAPKSFALPVSWEETGGRPIPVTVQTSPLAKHRQTAKQ